MLTRRLAAWMAILRWISGVVRRLSFPEKGFFGSSPISAQKARYSSTEVRSSAFSSSTEEPWAGVTDSFHQLFHGEVPEDRARVYQDTATPVRRESER